MTRVDLLNIAEAMALIIGVCVVAALAAVFIAWGAVHLFEVLP